jgi:uncharacterized integral membrane protein (TIGR00698 family)
MSPLLERWRARVPGAALCAVIALAATFVSGAHGGPQFLYALLLGMALHPFSTDARAVAGIDFCMKPLLRLGVALLGARIAADQVIGLGWQTAAMVVIAVASTIAVGVWLARALRLPASFGLLSGGATAICGASAALAISAVLPRRPDHDRSTLLVVVGVSTLSTVAMLLYPPLAAALGLSPAQTGVFLGAAIHDVAQVVGAAHIVGAGADGPAVIVKLSRVALLTLVVLAIGIGVRAQTVAGATDARRPPLLPGFLIAFLALVALNSAGFVPAAWQPAISGTSRACLVMAIAALGLKTSVSALREAGWRPLALMVGETAWLAALTLGLVIAATPVR